MSPSRDAPGNAYVANIVTDGVTFLQQTFSSLTFTKRVVVSLIPLA
jgi:hypothetical protein